MQQDTIVLYPSPGMDHVIYLVELGKLILHHCKHQFSVTVLLSPPSYGTTQASFSFRHLPRVPIDTTPTRSRAAMCFECIRLNAPKVRKELLEISRTSRISAFVIDMFCTSALSIGKALKIPTYYYFTSGAACLASFLCFPRIQEKFDKRFKDLTSTVLHFPCIPPLKAIHVPEPALDRDDPSYWDFIHMCSNLPRAEGIIVNSFDELEPKAIKILADGVCLGDEVTTPPVYCSGPLIAPGGGTDHDCLSWLDQQPKASVVFLCFGSRGTFCREQVSEIGRGLEGSGQRFLWVVKNEPSDQESKQTQDMSDFDLDSILPEGFLKRVQERAMVVKSWVPQLAVLNHRSVGGFVTHCGWNSVLEAVVAGIPMVAWPLYAEQHLNRNLLVTDMNMAIPVEQRDADGFVSGEELERRVRELMDSERGRELRERSREMKEKSLAAWGESGSSAKTFDMLVEIWKRG